MTQPSVPDPRPPDPLGLVFPALAFGIFTGVAVLSLVTWGIRTAQAGMTPPPETPTEAALYTLVAGTVVGVAAAGTATWSLLAPIRNPWRQAMLAMVAAFASFVLAAVVSMPVDRAFGRPGLLALAALATLACFGIGRRISRSRRSP